MDSIGLVSGVNPLGLDSSKYNVVWSRARTCTGVFGQYRSENFGASYSLFYFIAFASNSAMAQSINGISGVIDFGIFGSSFTISANMIQVYCAGSASSPSATMYCVPIEIL